MMKPRQSRERVAKSPVSESNAKMYEEHALTELRKAGYRITMPRVQVIRALADTKVALSAYAIHEKIIVGNGKIDVVSVYRILTTLQDVGLIYHIGIVDGYFPCYLEGSTSRSAVLVNEQSDQVYELKLPQEVIDEISRQGAENGFEMSTIKVEIVGCPIKK